MSKRWLACDRCRAAKERARYLLFDLVEWDGETPLVLFGGDEWFYSYDDILFFCEENETTPESLMMQLSEPMYCVLGEDTFESFLPVDEDYPAWLTEAVDAFNESVRDKVSSYQRIPKRVDITSEDIGLEKRDES